MRITLSIDSATADETHDFVCAFQRTAGIALPKQLNTVPTVTIGGSWSFGVTTPSMTHERAEAMLKELVELRTWREADPRRATLTNPFTPRSDGRSV